MKHGPQTKDSRTTATGTVAPPPVTESPIQHSGAKHPVTEFRFSRRRLPHWQSPGEVYFITFRTKDGHVLRPQERDSALAACRFWDGKKIELFAAVVMPDHVHLLVQPKPVEDDPRGLYPSGFYDLTEILHSIKSFSAHEIGKRRGQKGELWQHESYDRIVRDDAEFVEKRNYIANNAVMRKLAREPEDYPWLWYRGMKERTDASGTLAPPFRAEEEAIGGGATVPVAEAASPQRGER
jgi:REP element-mobilizing transposase RayT